MTENVESPKKRGIILAADVVVLIEREMGYDHRPSLTNEAEALVREACDWRQRRRETSSNDCVPREPRCGKEAE